MKIKTLLEFAFWKKKKKGADWIFAFLEFLLSRKISARKWPLHFQSSRIATVPIGYKRTPKKQKRFKKYQDLARGLKTLSNMTIVVISVVMCALGTPPRHLKEHLGKSGIETKIVDCQKNTIIHSAMIFRKILELWGVLLTASPKNRSYIDCTSVLRQHNALLIWHCHKIWQFKKYDKISK